MISATRGDSCGVADGDISGQPALDARASQDTEPSSRADATFEPDCWGGTMRLLLVAMTARRRRGLALAALLALSCQRSLTPVVPPSSQQGSGGSRVSGTGGNSGSTSPGTGGSGGPGGGAGVIDAGADRVTPPVDAARDAGVDRTAARIAGTGRPGAARSIAMHLPHMRPGLGAIRVRERQLRAAPGQLSDRLRQLQRQRQCRLRDGSVDRRQLRVLLASTAVPRRTCVRDTGRPSSARLDARRRASPSAAFSASICRWTPTTAGRAETGARCPTRTSRCQCGKCVFLSCNDPQFLDCTSDPGCETPIGGVTDCGSCGDPVCDIANTLFTCADGGSCSAAVCQSGFANCRYRQPRLRDDFRVAAGGRRLPSALHRHDGNRHPALQQCCHRDRARRDRSSWPARSWVRSISIRPRTATSGPRTTPMLTSPSSTPTRATPGRRSSPDAVTSS